MKRALLGLLICGLIVVTGGAACALDTGSYIVTPTIDEYRANLVGGTGFTVQGVSKVRSSLSNRGARELEEIIGMYARQNYKTKVAYVSFAFTAPEATYAWDSRELLYNFGEGRFDRNTGQAYASAAAADASPEVEKAAYFPQTFNGATLYEDSSLPIGYTAFISLKEGGYAPNPLGEPGGGSGCSALTAGAVALFLIPAFALARRGKK